MSKVLNLEFKSLKDMNEWLEWYIDGGGEQNANFYTVFKKSNYFKNRKINNEGMFIDKPKIFHLKLEKGK